MSNNISTSLAPMAGFTDAAFRRICSEFGAGYVVSEMISSVAMVMNDKKTAELARITEGEAPVVLQIFGHDPAVMAQAAEMLLSGSFRGCSYAAPPAGIDINMGCPVKKIVTNLDGSALMRDLDTARAVTAAAAEVCAKHGVPLSVKHRAGWDADSVNCAAFARAMAECGASKITLHTRTREQMYAPSANPALCREASAAAKSAAPVIFVGNGDIDSLASARMYLDCGCDEVAIGRAALGNPWLFAELKDPEGFVPPTLDEILNLVLRFVEDLVRDKGEVTGIRESRGRAAYFIRGMRGSAKVRDALNHAETHAAFCQVIEELRKTANG